MPKRAFEILFLFLFLTFLLPSIALAESNSGGKVVVFCLDGIESETLFKTDLPNFKYLITNGSIGLMSNQGYRGADTFRGYLTLGTGNRAPLSSYGAQCYEADEKGYPFSPRHVYQLQNGKNPGETEVLHLGLNLIKNAFKEPFHSLKVGALGEELNFGGLKTAVIGNSDLGKVPDPQTIYRFAPLVAMDADGLVDRGAVGEGVLKADLSFPYGVRINNFEVFSRFKIFYRQADFIVIEYGDTFRLNQYKEFLSEKRRKFLLKEVLQHADELVGKILREINFKIDLFMVVVPSTEETDNLGRPLSPLIIFGKGHSKSLLSSATSHQAGFVSNTDFAPTVLQFYGLKKSSYFLGNEIFSISSLPPKDRISFLVERSKRALLIDRLRKPMVIFFASLQVLLYFLTFLMILTRKVRHFKTFVATGLFLFLSLPLSFQVWPVLVRDWSSPFLPLVLLTVFFTFLLVRVYRWSGDKDIPYLIVSLSTFAWIVYDLFSGSKHSLDSIFGYSSIIGARFFGLGNEEMAILLSVFLLSLALMMEKNKKLAQQKVGLLVVIAVFLFIIGWPALGADFGGAITAFFALTLFFLAAMRIKISLKKALLVVLVGVLLVSSFIFYDLSRPSSSQTHLARTALLIENEGLSSLFLTISRKAETNWRVFRYSPWSYFFLLIFISLVVLFFRPVNWLKNFFIKKPFLRSAFYSSLWAGVVGFAINDSGIVIPALILSYFLPYLFLSLLEKADGAGA